MCWNVHGSLVSKLECKECVNKLREHGIVLLSETWTNEESEMELTGYDQVCKHTQRKKAGKRDSAGMVCFVREEIAKGVEEVSWKFEDGICLKLCKDFFGWEEDLFVLSVYMRPVNSTRADLDVDASCYDHLVEQIAVVSDRGNVIVTGDLTRELVNDKTV
ncbi:hypothetical protein ElyMa_002308200 [Elysia marginata]|uniref:Endonuclease/exonuclease/phosphatase domain-containing protein n=1 Tax=Elysia marginata TaxID=1093978 RepID=A0AAV4G4S8_9GAST|nr:hypothetical protein ElyMa_002308200 [Elysia marginata]